MAQKRSKNKGKILFAEDDKFLAEMFRQKLKIEGYEPIIAHTAISAILALKNEKPIAIILDIVLPDSECWMILEYLKRKKGRKPVPVMLLTNWGNNEYRQKAEELNADDFMVKASTTPEEIVKRMEKLIKKYQAKK